MTEREGPTLHSIQQFVSIAALVLIAALGWAFLVAGESAMSSMSGEGIVMELMWRMMRPSQFGTYLFAAVFMWVVMMIAMMIPAVIPMTAVFRRLERSGNPDLDAFIFAWGYLAGWSAYAAVAALFQWWLHANGWLHGMMLNAGATLTAGILIAAGVYQLTPLKEACLARCRSPMGFFLAHFRPGRLGAFRMGLHHGLFCIGCCWVLMLLMFVGGAMSVVTMALLCMFILAERLLPPGPWVSKLPGVVMIAWGGALLATG